MIYTNDIIKKKYVRKNRRKKIVRIITFPFVLAIVLMVLYIGYAKFIKKDESVSIFGYRQYIVATGSMEPTYNVGDLIVVKEVPKENIEKNDVITYTVGSRGETVTHRVVDKIEKDGKTYFRTKGDNNSSEDAELVEFNQIKGKILHKFNNLGIIIERITTGVGPMIVLLIAILAYIHTNVNEEKRITREIARKRYNIPRYKKEEMI